MGFQSGGATPESEQLGGEWACRWAVSARSHKPGDGQPPRGRGAGPAAHLPGAGELLQAAGHGAVREHRLFGCLIVIGTQEASRHACGERGTGESLARPSTRDSHTPTLALILHQRERREGSTWAPPPALHCHPERPWGCLTRSRGACEVRPS